MTGDSLLSTLFVFLLAAVLAVPGAERLGLGRVLGYLVAGVLVGPWGLALIREPGELQLLTDLGTGLLLFLLGTQLRPGVLQGMRSRMLLQGLPFWLVCSCLFLMLGLAQGLIWYKAMAVAVALALSSYTLVHEFIDAKNLESTSRGEMASSFATTQVLLFFPLLVLLPLLGFGNPLQEFTGVKGVLVDLALAIGLLGLGHFLLKQVFRYITASQSPELFVAVVLLMLVGSVWLFANLGSSGLLGAYLAGCLMGLSEFNKELASSIGPFKGLLLGFFFLTLGLSIDLGLMLRYPHIVLAVLILMLLIKFLVALLLVYLRDGWHRQHILTALLLAPAGELSFILLSVAMTFQALDRELGSGLMVVVALSMLLTPVLQLLYRRHGPLESDDAGLTGAVQATSGVTGALAAQSARKVPVMIIGFGRVGQTVTRLLASAGMQPIIIDHDPLALDEARRLGYRTLCGDARRLDLLEAAGVASARAMVIAIDDRRHCMALIALMQQHYPSTALVVRSTDRYHQIELACAGVDKAHRENFESAVLLGEDTLTTLGIDWEEAERISEAFRDHENRLIDDGIESGRERQAQGEEVHSPSLSLGYRQIDTGLAELLQKDFEAHTTEQSLKQRKS